MDLYSLAHCYLLGTAEAAAHSGEFVPDLVFIAKTFGLGVAVMAYWIYNLLRERAADKVEIRTLNDKLLVLQQAHSLELQSFLRDNLNAIPALVKIVEAVPPSVATSNDRVREHFHSSVESLKTLIANQCEGLRTALANIPKPNP